LIFRKVVHLFVHRLIYPAPAPLFPLKVHHHKRGGCQLYRQSKMITKFSVEPEEGAAQDSQPIDVALGDGV
jgi:hypothetical protein